MSQQHLTPCVFTLLLYNQTQNKTEKITQVRRAVAMRRKNRTDSSSSSSSTTIALRPQLERYKKEVERLRDMLTQREVELRASNDARDAAIAKQMRVAENNRLLILEVKERGEDLKDDRVALQNAQRRIQSLQKRCHYLLKSKEKSKDASILATSVEKTKSTTTSRFPKSPWHSHVESVSSDHHHRSKKFDSITPIPLRERSFNEIHSTMINNLGDLSRDLKRGASAILSSSPLLRRSARKRGDRF